MPHSVHRVAAASLALLALVACAHDRAGMPLPPGWGSSPPDAQTRRWGVPDFSPPSAADCQRSPQPRELGGSAQAPQHARGRAAEAMADVERRDAPASLASKSAPMAAPHMPMPPQQPQRTGTPVTAGMVDDNADFGEYLAFVERSTHLDLRRRDIAERYRVEVRDALDRPVPDAEIALAWRGGASAVWARSDAGGSAWLHPRAVLPPQADGHELEVQVRSGSQVARARLQRGQKASVQLKLPRAAELARPKLDLVFLIDATGSMGDEIHKLKTSLRTIADQIAQMPGRPDLCLGLVAYRDHGDAFLVRRHDLSNRLPEFQTQLARLHAGGGGDYPEAMHEALHEAMHGLSWRGTGTTRLVVLLADAPPHLDDGSPPYDDAVAVALAKGIKLHAVGASGLDPQGEAVLRQMAQYSGGRFVFLTYRDAHDPSSGPGRETPHDVRNYSVDTLDRLIVRLVREELARRPTS